MGLLGDIFSAGNTAKRRLRGLLDDPIGSMQQAVDNAFPTRYEAQNALSQLRGQPYNPDALQAYNTKLDSAAMNFAPMGMTVWHGSPHKFSKFDMSKIGTGEGAQAYGHGLYMAESPEVAKSYADELGQLEILHNNKVVGVFDKDPAANAAHQIRATGGDIDKAIKRAQNIYTGAWRDNVVNEIKKLGPGEVSERVNGSMYKVDIPDEAVARFLDWDKPLSQQAINQRFRPEVAGGNSPPVSIDDLLKKEGYQGIDDFVNRGKTGQELYARLSTIATKANGGDLVKGQNEAATLLNELGIPGIRYLDGGSRSTGQGSSNFVLFDDQLPRILETNGVPTGLQPWKPNEWQGLLGGGR